MKILKFEAPWCGQCEALDYNLDDPEIKMRADIEHINVDTEEGEKLVKEYQIRSIPTLVVLDRNNKEVTRIHGLRTTSYLVNKLRGRD